MFEQPLVGEPAPVDAGASTPRSTRWCRAVLTDEDADIDALLDAAQTQVQSLLDQG